MSIRNTLSQIKKYRNKSHQDLKFHITLGHDILFLQFSSSPFSFKLYGLFCSGSTFHSMPFNLWPLCAPVSYSSQRFSSYVLLLFSLFFFCRLNGITVHSLVNLLNGKNDVEKMPRIWTWTHIIWPAKTHGTECYNVWTDWELKTGHACRAFFVFSFFSRQISPYSCYYIHYIMHLSLSIYIIYNTIVWVIYFTFITLLRAFKTRR